MRRKLFALLMAICLLGSLTLCAGAAGFYGDSVSGKQQGSVFASGYAVTNDADIDGIAFLAGESVASGGNAEYLAAAARTVRVEGSVEKDAFLAAQEIYAEGTVGRDLFAASQRLVVAGDVGGTLYGAAETIVIQGDIQGDAYLSADNIVIDAGVTVGGTLHYPDSAKVSAEESLLSGAIVEQTEQKEAPSRGESVGKTVVNKLVSFIGLAAVALVLLWLTPLWETVDRRYTGKPFGAYAAAFGIGVAALIGVPLAAVLLMITLVGLRLAFLLLAVYVAALIASGIFAAFFVGSLLWRKAFKKAPKLWAELLIGTAAWTLLGCIPVVSMVVGFVGVPFGLGMVTGLITSAKGPRRPEAPKLPEGTEE